jgi:ferrous iron transport protein B
MIDVFEKQKHEIDIGRLSKKLGVRVVAMDAKTGRGVEDLEREVAAAKGSLPNLKIEFDSDVSDDTNAKIFSRYKFISDAIQDSVRHNDRDAHRVSDKIDRVLTHKFFGLVILVAVLLLIFQTIFTWATVPMDLLDSGFGSLGDIVRSAMPTGVLTDLVVDGIIAGVGGVLVFLPQILLLFLFISLLEDSGYMARAAFLMDRLMSRVGLHGKAFLPLISSFACAIPGIMATRTIEDQRDRFATIMIAPFMSCSARLPVYTLMIAAFFAGQTVLGFISLGAVADARNVCAWHFGRRCRCVHLEAHRPQSAAAALYHGAAAVSNAECSHGIHEHARALVALRKASGYGHTGDLDHPLGVDVLSAKRSFEFRVAGFKFRTTRNPEL